MIADFFLWWYGTGWGQVFRSTENRARGVLEYFSVGLLTRTLFSPFRQIDARSARGPIGARFSAWFGRQFSRFVGSMLRLTMILIGLSGALFTWLFGTLWLLLWPLLPVLPLVALILLSAGVGA